MIREKVIKFWKFFIENKIWWITPMVVLFFIFLALYVLGTSATYPAFVYSMFY